MIIMKHPETGGVIRVPDRSQSIYERSGWVLDESGTKVTQDQEESGAAPEAAGPVTDKEQARLAEMAKTAKEDSGDAGSRTSASRQASKSKEEGK